jgi:uncharacterized protein (TIGR00297 family)
VLVSAGVSAFGWLLGALSPGGAVSATVVGALILSGSGWYGGAVLAVFFVSSSLVSRLARAVPDGLDPKGERRDAWQVLANGGPAALAAVLAPDDILLRSWLVTASLAAAAADTWATSVGSLSRMPPRLLWNGRRVAPGTSGGVSGQGTAGALVGAGLVSFTGAWATGLAHLAIAGTLIGFAGMLLDSLLGGTAQGRFYCRECDQQSEWKRHRCGSRTELKGGLAWLDNDVVNGLVTGSAVLVALVLWRWLD